MKTVILLCLLALSLISLAPSARAELSPEKKHYFRQWMETQQGKTAWKKLSHEQKTALMTEYLALNPRSAVKPEAIVECLNRKSSLPTWDLSEWLLGTLTTQCQFENGGAITADTPDPRKLCLQKETGLSANEIEGTLLILMGKATAAGNKMPEKIDDPKQDALIKALRKCRS